MRPHTLMPNCHCERCVHGVLVRRAVLAGLAWVTFVAALICVMLGVARAVMP